MSTEIQYDDLQHNAAQIDAAVTAVQSLAPVALSGAYADLTGKPVIDTALSPTSTNAVQNSAVSAALSGKADSADLTAESAARASADSALRQDVDGKIPFGLGTAITDQTDPDTQELYADLFELQPGKYQRSTNLARVRNRPPGFTGGFYCIVECTVTASRRKITLYPASAADAGTFYVAVETATGYGSWYKFEGTVQNV